MIYKIEDYYSDGRHIREYMIVDGEKPDDFSHFVGVGSVEVNIDVGRGHNITKRFTFPIDAPTIVEAFEKFDDIYNREKPLALEREQAGMNDLVKSYDMGQE